MQTWKKCVKKNLNKLHKDEVGSNLIEAQIIININGLEISIQFYEPQTRKVGRGLDDPQVGMLENMCNILHISLNLNGLKYGKTNKLYYASQKGRNSNNPRICKYGENANGKISNRLLQDKVHINFIQPHLIAKLNASAGGIPFDEM